jgi:CRP-like cAMP-binding protein
MIRYPSQQQLSNCGLENVTSWKLKKSHSVDNINDSLKEWGLIRIVENLDCSTLHYLLKSRRIILEQRMILRLMATLVHYNFSARTMTRTLEHTRLSANLAFQILIQRVPTTKYSLLSDYIAYKIWYDQENLSIFRKSAKARLATFIYKLISNRCRYGFSPPTLHLPMSRTDIDNYLGLSLETVSRLFSNLQRSGIIATKGRYITVHDSDKSGNASH